MKSVFARSTLLLQLQHRAGVGGVEHVQGEAARVAERAPDDLRARATSRPCPSSAASVRPSAFTCVDELLQVAGVLEHRLGDREPAEPVADLGPGAAPQRLVLAPDARGRRPRSSPAPPAWRARARARRGSRSRSSAGRPVTAASLLDSTPAISLSNGVTNAAMPSRSSLSVTSSMSMPASASALERLGRVLVGGGARRSRTSRRPRAAWASASCSPCRAPPGRPRTSSRDRTGSSRRSRPTAAAARARPPRRSAAKRSPRKMRLKLW